MRCPNCGTENLPGSRFCEQCGADLRTLANQAGGFPASGASVGGPPPPPGVFQSSTQPSWPPTPQPTLIQMQPTPRRRGRGCLIAIAVLLLLCVVLPIAGSFVFPSQFDDFWATVEVEMTRQAISNEDATSVP